jgi:hypothetical protein
MSIVPPEAPVGRPKPAQALVEEMITTVRRMRDEVEALAKNSRWEDLNFLIPFEAPAGRPFESRLETLTSLVETLRGIGVPPEQLAPFLRDNIQVLLTPRTTAQAMVVKPVTPVSRDFVDELMDLSRWCNKLATHPMFRAYARRVAGELMTLMSMVTYRGGKPVLLQSPSEVYSKLVAMEGVLQFLHPLTLEG